MYSIPYEQDVDIIIVGGGISGLSAAYYLLQCEPSLDLVILEASNRVGGRTFTLPLKTSSNEMRDFDLGGQFLKSPQPFLKDLLDNLGLQEVSSDAEEKTDKIIFDLDPKSSEFLSLNLSELAQRYEWLEVEKFFNNINTMCLHITFDEPHIDDYCRQLDYTTMDEFILLHLNNVLAQNFVRHLVHISCGLEAFEISVLFYLAFCNATGGMQNQVFLNNTNSAWIREGADQICYKLESLIGKEYIKMNDPVVKVNWDSSKAVIQTEHEIYRARYVILAIPPISMLNINFNPTLDNLKILTNLNSGNLIKFIVTYKTAFWRKRGYNGTVISCRKKNPDYYIRLCFDITYNKSPALCGYLSTRSTDGGFKNKVLEELSRYFGTDALNTLDYIDKNWLEDKSTYVRACFTSAPKLGQMNNYTKLRRPLGHLYWAGTELSSWWNGQMEGAVQSGYRAASEILYHFRPQSMIFHEGPQTQRTYSNKPIRYITY
ncbi:hypothetical protein FQR65_LT03856 [Abscondita terminalis]|nr:hypothetical protein FQR65_LT03856 [Abscondita terminalis]